LTKRMKAKIYFIWFDRRSHSLHGNY